MSEIERRNFAGEMNIVAAMTSSGRGQKIVGYAAVFNSPSRPLPLTKNSPEGRSFREIIRPGAFKRALASGREIFARLDHESYLGRTGNGTLRVTEDSRGLRYEVDLPDTAVGRDVMALIRRGDVRESSFEFRVTKGGDAWRRDNGELVRELRSVDLFDVGPVFVAAYPATDAALRSLKAWEGEADNCILMRMRLRLAEAAI